MNRPIDDSGGGTLVQINIAEFRVLIKGMESAADDLETADRLARSNLSRLSLSPAGMNRLHPVLTWLTDEMPGLRRRLALAEALAQTTPGLPNSVTFAEESLTTLTPEQARQQAHRAARLLEHPDPDQVHELGGLLAAYGDDPYFAHEFALRSDPRQYAELIRGLTPYEELPGYLTKHDYDGLLTNLANTVSLASRGTGDLAMPPDWSEKLAQLMVMPRFDGKDEQQLQRDDENRPALWLLLSRGHWSTDFLKNVTTKLAAVDKEGYLWFPPACRYIAITPDEKRFMDPMVALMGALVNNPEAAHWAFTQGGTTQVPFPKDGEGATGPVQTFLHDLFTSHRFTDEEHGPQTVLLALRAAMAWQDDPFIAASATNLKKSMEQQKEVWDEKPWYAKWGHTILDVLGLIPIIGDPADAVSAAWYSAEGDWVDAGLSAASLIPFAGDVLGAGKLVGRAGKLAELLKMVDRFGNVIEPGSPLARSLVKGMKVEDGVYTFPNAADLSTALRARYPNMEFRSRELAFVTDEAGEVSALRVYVDGQWVPVTFHGNNLHLASLKAGDSPWDLIPRPRGDVIEHAVAHSTYADWEHLGKGSTRGIDVYKNGRGISIKTMDPPNPGSARLIEKNIDYLAQRVQEGTIASGRRLRSAEVDLRVRIGTRTTRCSSSSRTTPRRGESRCMSTPTEQTRIWSVFTFLPGSLSVADGARLVSDVDLRFTPTKVRLLIRGDDDLEPMLDLGQLPELIASQDDCWGLELDDDQVPSANLSIDATRVRSQLSLHGRVAPDPRLVSALVAHPGFIAGAAGDNVDVRWQSETSPDHYRMWYDGPWEHLPRTLDEVGREVIDVSGNPGRMTDVPGMRLWAAQDTWFGPDSSVVIDVSAVATLPVGRVSDLGHGRWHVRLWEDGAPLEEIRKAQQVFREHLRYDEAPAREDDIWDALTEGRPDDPMFVVQEGSFPHGGTTRFLQYFAAKDYPNYPTVRSRAAWLNIQEFDGDHRRVHEEDVDLTTEPHPEID